MQTVREWAAKNTTSGGISLQHDRVNETVQAAIQALPILDVRSTFHCLFMTHADCFLLLLTGCIPTNYCRYMRQYVFKSNLQRNHEPEPGWQFYERRHLLQAYPIHSLHHHPIHYPFFLHYVDHHHFSKSLKVNELESVTLHLYI